MYWQCPCLNLCKTIYIILKLKIKLLYMTWSACILFVHVQVSLDGVDKGVHRDLNMNPETTGYSQNKDVLVHNTLRCFMSLSVK